MVQERHPFSKAFKSEILFEMPKKIKDGCSCLFYSLFLMLVLAWPVEVSFQKCVLMLYFFLKEVKLKNNNNWTPGKVTFQNMRQFQLLTYPHSDF